MAERSPTDAPRRDPDATSGGGPVRWHAMAEEELLRWLELASAAEGLSEAEARSRQERFGKNLLPAAKPVTLAAIVLHQFLSPLIYILLAAAAVAVALQDLVDAGFILAVVLLNAGLGTFQEWRAEQSAAGLQRLLKVQARVRRQGAERRIAAEDLVPGDIVLIESGNRVPADLRLLRANNLSADESFLTGESMAVDKTAGAVAANAPVSERLNMAFAGATVVSGRGEGVVVATGLRTEVGAIAETVTAAETTKPPLLMRMEAFARQISLVVLAACVLLALVALGKGMPYVEVFFLAVALAVSAIPEGLPVAVTVTLSIATNRMARRNVIVRRLTAVEGLGSCTFIASDKTGTLTVNRQTVRLVALPSGERFRVSGEGYAGEGEVTAEAGAPEDARPRLERAVRAGVLCNEATLAREGEGWKHDGDAVDVALLALGYKIGLDPAAVRAGVRIVGEIPFESERSYAATFYEEGGRTRVAVKGALETLLPRCRTMLAAKGPVELEAEAVERQANEMSEQGHRFLAIAEGDLAEGARPGSPGEGDLPPLTLLALVGLIDPPRPEAKEAVAKCQRAGIEVAMVTGDHPLTAFAIARELGIAASPRSIVTGRQLEEAGGPEGPDHEEAVRSGRVFARVSPMQKLHIVDALRRLGHFVAVTGDGVNDAPALKRANISVAMGSGSDVTKDTASLIVTDDNFASIEAGVEEGRFAYDNIRKVTYLLISSGAAEVLLFVLALFAGFSLPLLPVQLLWLNLVTNGIQDVALAFEGGEPGAMARPPRKPDEGIFNALMVRQTVVAGAVMGLVGFAFWGVLLTLGQGESDARNRLLLLLVLMQNYHVFNCRSEYDSAFAVPLKRNYVLAFGVLAAQGLHVLAMHLPLTQGLLRVSPVAARQWVTSLFIATSILAAMEIFKAVRGGRRRR